MRILVADPDEATRSLIHTRLSVRGYEVIEVTSAEDMLAYLDQETASVILVSTEIDALRGGYFIEKIRMRPHLASVPVIMMTDYDHIAELVVGQERGFDDFLLKPFDAFTLQLRIAINIRKIKERIDANALTHLPGNHAIERVINEKIENREKFSVLYIDISNFKTFNDLYGFEKGDDVIKHTAKMLVETGESVVKSGDCFVGHVGGDDFVVVVSPEYEELYARSFLDEFDRIAVTYYSEEDRKRGSVRVTNRRGKRETFPLMSCSVAACNNVHREYKGLGEIAQDAAEVKAFLKSQPGSHYLRDRRCDPIRQLEHAIQMLAPEVEKKKKGKTDSEPLGKLLLKAGRINEEQLTQALKKHIKTGKKLGQILIAMGAIRSEELGQILSRKMKIPYLNLRSCSPQAEALKLFSPDYMRRRGIVPFEVQDSVLKVAMCEPADKSLLKDLEQISNLKPAAHFTLENEVSNFWREYFEGEPYGQIA